MSKDLGFSEGVYGFGAGIFFLGYLIFEIPSNLFLERIGARKTIARITLLWGLTSIAMMFVKTATWFYTLRFLLGAFEAGLVPGVYLYLTYWFPTRHRAQMTGIFQTAVPIAGILGGPISGWIMGALGDQAGLANWQWLFLLEGIPSIVLGILALGFVVDTPAEARWLTAREKQSVLDDLEEDHHQAGPRTHGFGEALREPRVWLLTLIYFLSRQCQSDAQLLGADDYQRLRREEQHDNRVALGGAESRRCRGDRLGQPSFGPDP